MSTQTTHKQEALIEACKRGDRKAQYKLYQQYSRAMLNLAVRMLGDRAAAEDALQEAFVSAFRNLHRFEGRSTFGAWLKRIVINRCLTQLKASRMEVEPLGEEAAEQPDWPEEALPALDGETIHQAIKELPRGCRVVFSLYQLEGYDHQEISEIMDISVSTSKSQYHRAKKLLQQKLTVKLKSSA